MKRFHVSAETWKRGAAGHSVIEIDPVKITRRIASVPKDLIRSEYLTRLNGRGRVPDDVIAEIVDEVFLPLVRSH